MEKVYKLAEVAAITGLPLETLKTDSKRGNLPTQLAPEGKRLVKVISAATLATLLQKKDCGSYESLKEQWRGEMLAGTHSGTSTPVSENYLGDLEWGLKKFWAVNGIPSVEGLSADGLREAFAQFQFDEVLRRDYYSSKMHIYKAVSSFTQFLIRKGYKAPSTLEEIKSLRPKARIKPKRHSLELVQVWEAINFNQRWNDGRTRHDIQIMDMLLCIYGFAGLRRMEAANVKISGINFSKNEILVPGKWGKDRLVPMPQQLADKVQEWIDILRPESNLPYLLVNSLGNQLNEKSISLRFSRLSKALALHKALVIVNARSAGQQEPQHYLDGEIFFLSRSRDKLLKEAEQLTQDLNCAVRPHDLRRAYAKMLSDQGMPVPRIQYVLGHSDIETTMKYINIQQKEATDWIRENFNVTLPIAQPKLSDEPAAIADAKEVITLPVKQPEPKRRFKY